MTGSLAGVDAGTAELILAMPCAGNDDVLRWFGLVQECHLANPTDFSAFASLLRTQASTFDSTAIGLFLERAKNSGEGTAVARVLDHLPAHVDVYWQLAKPQATPTPADPLAWVDEVQAQRLSTAWGQDWRTYLTQQLDYRWGNGWQANPTDHKQAWLTDLLTELLAASTPSTAPDPLAWLTEEQTRTLSTAWGQDWRTYLTQQLDYRWGNGWQANPTDHKRAWLTDLLTELVPASGTGTPAKAEPVDLDRIAEELVRESLAEVDGAESLSESDLVDVIAEVRRNLEVA